VLMALQLGETGLPNMGSVGFGVRLHACSIAYRSWGQGIETGLTAGVAAVITIEVGSCWGASRLRSRQHSGSKVPSRHLPLAFTM